MKKNNKKTNKFVELFNKFNSSEAALRRLPIYFFIICILLTVLVIKIHNTNKFLKEISNNGTQVIEGVMDLTIETTKSIQDVFPDFTTNDESTTLSTNGIQSYVINTDSKKIHYSGCYVLNNTSDSKKKYIDLNEEELKEYLNNGYEFCKKCGG